MILNINKPKGITSHDVVSRVRKITGEKKVGHGGTLDPLATGVLIVGVGRDSTKKLGELLKETDKEYEAIIELGKASTTDDAEGEISIKTTDLDNLDEQKIKMVLNQFKGVIKQTPPAYSAVKVNGKPAYTLVRGGKQVELSPRDIEIKELELLDVDLPFIQIRTLVSSGTYIRSLARDIGQMLGTGAFLKELTRTKVGEFVLEKSITLKELSKST